MKAVDKRSWVCTNPACSFSDIMSARLINEVPREQKCPICGLTIWILSEKEQGEPSFSDIFHDRI